MFIASESKAVEGHKKDPENGLQKALITPVHKARCHNVAASCRTMLSWVEGQQKQCTAYEDGKLTTDSWLIVSLTRQAEV